MSWLGRFFADLFLYGDFPPHQHEWTEWKKYPYRYYLTLGHEASASDPDNIRNYDNFVVAIESRQHRHCVICGYGQDVKV